MTADVHRAGLPARAPLLTYEELSIWLNTSVRHLRRLVDEGRIPFHKVGWFVRFDEDEIASWLAGNGQETTERPRGRTARASPRR